MNLETRKIEFIQEFLKLQSEEAISRFEKILSSESKFKETKIYKPMTQEQLDTRIDKSESDFRNNRFKSSSELLAKFQ